jgi:hypothetical protein
MPRASINRISVSCIYKKKVEQIATPQPEQATGERPEIISQTDIIGKVRGIIFSKNVPLFFSSFHYPSGRRANWGGLRVN